jgi:hypothetical protein
MLVVLIWPALPNLQPEVECLVRLKARQDSGSPNHRSLPI